MKRLGLAVTGVLLAALLTGCGGLLLLALAGLEVGNLYAQVRDFVGLEASDYTMVFDGYDLGINPNPNGTLDLRGLPSGTHLLSIVSEDERIGFHRVVDITSGSGLNLGQINLEIGAVISGRVERQVGSTVVPLAGVRVAAAYGGPGLLSAGAGAPLTFPPTEETPTVVMAFTDANGNYRLGPCQFGEWLVTAAYPGFLTDVTFCTVASGSSASGQNLLLKPATTSQPATIRGTVTREGGGALAHSLVNADLRTALAPLMDAARVSALSSQTGVTFMAEPWFRWRSLATVTTVAGAYDFEVPPGTMDVYALKYGYKARTAEFTLGSAVVQVIDFALQPR